MDIAAAYANLGKAYLDLADALSAPQGPSPAATAPVGAPGAPTFDDLPPDDSGAVVTPAWEGEFNDLATTPHAKPSGSAAVCPAHGIQYRKGRYGAYCPSTSEDPKWSNDKGYCTVTPKSAAAWLRQHA